MAVGMSRWPALPLHGLVHQFWYWESDASSAELKLPTLENQLIFALSDDRIAEAGLTGIARSAVRLDASGPRRLVGAVLAPGAMLFQIHATAVTDHFVELTDLGVDIDDLQRPCGDIDSTFVHVESWLMQRTADSVNRSIAPALATLASGSRVPEAARVIGRSESSLLREFRRSVGTTPKHAQRLIRMQRAVSLLRSGTDLAAVAYQAGYADQAHFTHDFNDLTSLSPGEYRRQASEQAMHVALTI